jgi:hypothetical protein
MTGRDETDQFADLPRVITGPDGEEWILAGYDEAARFADLARMLSDVDEFLRSPGVSAALEEFCAARGSISPGYDAGLLIDGISFTVPWLRDRGQGQRP